MTGLLTLPVAVPLLAAGLLLVVPRLHRLHRILGVGVNAGVLVVGGVILMHTLLGAPVLSENVGGWLPGVSIVLAADTFSALLVCVTALLAVVCLQFAFATGDASHRLFTPLSLIMVAGVYGAYLTADLFNLFVFIEVMLVPSYALLVLTGRPARLAAGRLYVATNLFASTVLLVGIGLIYGQLGTVNLGDLAGTGSRSPAAAMAAAVVLVAMAIKAALVPLHSWLPRTYPYATAAVTALFSGLLTKVAVYAIFRIYAVVFDGGPRYAWVIMVVALLTMIIGVLGAAGENTMRAILSFHMVSQVGYIILGPALATVAGMAAAIFYFIQYVLVKAALLVCAGAVEATYGTGRLDRLGGVLSRAPLLAVAFMVAALSLAGMPPLSGFVAKLIIVRATIIEASYLAAAVAVLVALLTLLSMLKLWNGVFWGSEGSATWGDDEQGRPVATKMRMSLVSPALILAGFSLILGVGAQPLLVAAEAAAAGLVDPSAYVAAVQSALP